MSILNNIVNELDIALRTLADKKLELIGNIHLNQLKKTLRSYQKKKRSLYSNDAHKSCW